MKECSYVKIERMNSDEFRVPETYRPKTESPKERNDENKLVEHTKKHFTGYVPKYTHGPSFPYSDCI